jgi:hypothetical protein
LDVPLPLLGLLSCWTALPKQVSIVLLIGHYSLVLGEGRAVLNLVYFFPRPYALRRFLFKSPLKVLQLEEGTVDEIVAGVGLAGRELLGVTDVGLTLACFVDTGRTSLLLDRTSHHLGCVVEVFSLGQPQGKTVKTFLHEVGTAHKLDVLHP